MVTCLTIESVLLLVCCEEQQVDPLCRSFLCAGELAPTDSGVDLLPCYSNIDKVFQCISGKSLFASGMLCCRGDLVLTCLWILDNSVNTLTHDLPRDISLMWIGF